MAFHCFAAAVVEIPLSAKARELGFDYLPFQRAGIKFMSQRPATLLGDDMGVYREDAKGRPEYNWQYIDEVYDFLLRIGMKPFVELGFMPEALSTHPQPYRHDFPTGDVFTGSLSGNTLTVNQLGDVYVYVR